MSELLKTEETLSPMEDWRRKHKILTYSFENEIVANVDGDSVKGKGRNKEESLMDWARKTETPCWKSEILKGKDGE